MEVPGLLVTFRSRAADAARQGIVNVAVAPGMPQPSLHNGWQRLLVDSHATAVERGQVRKHPQSVVRILAGPAGVAPGQFPEQLGRLAQVTGSYAADCAVPGLGVANLLVGAFV